MASRKVPSPHEKSISDILGRYQEKVRGWKSHNVDLPIVVNKELDLLAQAPPDEGLTWIVVGDNPSEKEQSEGVYFSSTGQSGTLTRLLLRLGASGYPERVAFLNKCPIYSTSSSDLWKVLDSHPMLMRDMQVEVANTVFRLHKMCMGAKVWIMGLGGTYNSSSPPGFYVDNCRRGPRPLFPFFFGKIRERYMAELDLRSRLFVTPHVSGGNQSSSPFLDQLSEDKLFPVDRHLTDVLSVFDQGAHLFGRLKKCRNPIPLTTSDSDDRPKARRRNE